MMESKICSVCLEEKPLTEFHFKNKSAGLYEKDCKICRSKKAKERYENNRDKVLNDNKTYRENNPEKIRLKSKRYYKDNKDSINFKNKEWSENNKESISKRKKTYYENNKELFSERYKTYYENNREYILNRNKIYSENNRDKISESIRLYHNKRRSEDTLFRMISNIRRSILHSLKINGYTKKSKTCEILGCTFEELVNHLESNPYNFKISDIGLDIDHIVPLSIAKSEEEVIKLNHHTNLQLLPSFYNRHIKSDKMFDINHFEDWLKQQSLE